ncbi:hypothetical protein F3J20_12885 [Paraburkholderia sp. Cy-641]|uniref:hypothetical protein n=1 Tax=Paraburkholderia sp. Cy-641 TaxID=2608337 RepID=UPI001420509E|nr:hypothetical protein [Paraburkholderia sp. Cy-641]NIF78273.1 hypothetical protein [Paraburkholderia sp. Cy-641]
MYSPYHDNRPGKWPFPDSPIRGFAAVFFAAVFHRVFSSGFFQAAFSSGCSSGFFSDSRPARHYLPPIRQPFCGRCQAASLLFSAGAISVVFETVPSTRPFAQDPQPFRRKSGKKKPAMKAGKIAVLDA